MVPVDFNGLLGKLRKRIIDIHAKNIGQGEVDGKPTLSLLNEIEVRIIGLTRKLARKRVRMEADVKLYEKKQGDLFKTEKQTQLRAKQEAEEDAKK